MTDNSNRPDQEESQKWMHRQGEIIDDILFKALFETCASDMSLRNDSLDRGKSLETARAIFEERPTLDLNRETDGTTPLITSIIARNAALTKMLLDHGASLDMPDAQGISPMEYAKEGGCHAIEELLKQRAGSSRSLRSRNAGWVDDQSITPRDAQNNSEAGWVR